MNAIVVGACTVELAAYILAWSDCHLDHTQLFKWARIDICLFTRLRVQAMFSYQKCLKFFNAHAPFCALLRRAVEAGSTREQDSATTDLSD